MRRGLVLGKFMPLHRGHQLLIDAAIAQCDDVTIVVYDSVVAGGQTMPLRLRLSWLRELYPEVESIVPLADSETDAAGYARELAFLGPFDRFFSSEPSYQAFADALGARHVVVDAARATVPVSGTAIRADPYANRAWLHPDVYASLVRKVVLVGTESAGKTTLARRLAEETATLWTHEYGRELWEQQGLQGSFADHLHIAVRQLRREEAARREARRYLFCDTNAWTTLQWSLLSYGTADARLHELVDRTTGDYIWVVCDDDFDWVQDGTRELAGGRAHEFQRQQVEDLDRRGLPYVVARGPLENRVATVLAALEDGRADRYGPHKVLTAFRYPHGL